MAACMRLLTDSYGNGIVDKKMRQLLTEIPKRFLEVDPFWQIQLLQMHFSSNLVESLAYPTNRSMQNLHPQEKREAFH